jgi:crossover junction endodeoxyribonuclease RusA
MTLDRITIRLPWPDPALFPNAKGGRHWATYQAQKVRARQDGFFAAKQALGGHAFAAGVRVPVKATFVYPDRINRDIEGCIGAIKHYIDGVSKALGVDDRIFRPWTLDDAMDTKRQGFVIVEIG